MNKYAIIALKAIELVQKTLISPNNAWDEIAAEVFYNSPSSRDKGCPKGAFLGLCEEGMVKGIPVGNYTMSVKNKKYAILAVKYLISNGLTDKNKLWKIASGGDKVHNAQMYIVLELWKVNLIDY